MTNRAPVIGITSCSRLADYVTSVERAGGRPRVLEVGESPRALVGQIDGLLLTGGGDVDPVFYREDRHPTTDDAEPGRDEFEIDLARRARDADLPVLGICRGSQVMNVAAGGTLVQDIPSLLPEAAGHSLLTPKTAHAHAVAITADSRLSTILGAACEVNSRHHQAIGRLGDRLRISASAPDGIVEAIEAPGATFCLGVQWHPENFCESGAFAPLFTAFVDAARERMETRADG